MKRILSSLLVLLLLVSVGASQSVEVPKEVNGTPGVFVVVTAKTDCAALRWVPLDVGLSMIPPELLKDSRSAVVMAAKEGSYKLLAYGAKGDNASPPAIVTVVFGKPTPPVPPDPPTPPAPVTGKLWVVVVIESGNVTPEQAKVFRDPSLWEKVVKDGHKYRVYDKDDPAIAKYNFAPFIERAGGVPAVVLMEESGKVVKSVPLPGSADLLAALIKETSGK